MTTSCTDQTHPYYTDISKLLDKKLVDFFTGENSFRMRHVTLGEALDFTSFGGMNYVVWPTFNHKKLVEFIQIWMENQPPKIEYEEIPDPEIKGCYTLKEKSREYHYTWNRFHNEFTVELPVIRNERCIIEGHQGTVKDLAGRIRCANKQIKGDEIRRQIKRNKGKVCYSIISDAGTYLPLESILLRLDVNNFADDKIPVFPFSGFTLANYVKAWLNQPGERKLFLPNKQKEHYREYPNFRLISSDD